MPFSNSSRVVASDDQVFTTLGDEAVILGLVDGVYYGLDAVGAHVWARIAAPVLVRELVAGIVEAFDVTPAECERDVLALLDDMERRGLVRLLPAEHDQSLS